MMFNHLLRFNHVYLRFSRQDELCLLWLQLIDMFLSLKVNLSNPIQQSGGNVDFGSEEPLQRQQIRQKAPAEPDQQEARIVIKVGKAVQTLWCCRTTRILAVNLHIHCRDNFDML